MPTLSSRPSRVTGRLGRQTLGVNVVSLHAREPRALVAGGAQLTGLEHALPRHVASGRMDPADAVSVRAAGFMVRARSLVGAAAVPRAIASVYCLRGSLAGLTELIDSASVHGGGAPLAARVFAAPALAASAMLRQSDDLPLHAHARREPRTLRRARGAHTFVRRAEHQGVGTPCARMH
jgi:hypothetical protein